MGGLEDGKSDVEQIITGVKPGEPVYREKVPTKDISIQSKPTFFLVL